MLLAGWDGCCIVSFASLKVLINVVCTRGLPSPHSSSAADAFLNSKARSVVCRSEHVGRLLVKVPPPALCAVVCGRQLVAVNEGTLFIHSTLGDAQSFSLQARLPVPRLKQGITSRDRLSLKPVLLSVTCEDRASIPDSVCLHKRFFQLLFGAESVLGGQAHVLVGCTSGQVLFCAPSSLSFSSHPLLCDLGQPVVGIYAPTISPAESLFFLGQQGKLVVCKVAPSHAQLVFQEFCCTAPVLSSVVSGETIFYSTTTGVYSVAMGGSSSGKVLPKKLLRGSCFILETLPGLRLVAVSTSGKFNLINVPDQDGLLGTGACFKDSLLGMQLLSECVAQVQVCLCECELHLSCLSQALSVCRDVVGGSSQLPCAPTPALLQGSPCVKAELSALGSSWSVFLQLKDEDFCVSTSVYHLSCADPGSPLVPLHSSRTVLQCFLSYSFDCVCPTADHIFPDVLIPFSTQSFSGLNFLSRENVDPAEPVCESPISVLVDVPLPSLSKAATDLVSSSLNKQQTLVTTHKGTRMRLVASPLSAGSTRLSMEAATLYPLLELAAHLVSAH